MAKYRVKIMGGSFFNDYYKVQVKHKFLPFWITISSMFSTSEMANNWIYERLNPISYKQTKGL